MDSGIIVVYGIELGRINLFPSGIVEEVVQNIKTILTTIVGTVPLDRRFGLDAGFIDNPHPRAMMKLSIFIVESIREYEPRAEVTEIDFAPRPDAALDGKLYPKVTVKILDEFLN